MAPTPPPSFSSFPDFNSNSNNIRKQQPPAFASFPSPSPPPPPPAPNNQEGRPAKRHRPDRGDDFLQSLEVELGLADSRKHSSRSNSRDRDKRKREKRGPDDPRESEERRSHPSSSRHHKTDRKKEKERESSKDKEERHRSKSERRKDDFGGRDKDYGKSEKPYKLIKTLKDDYRPATTGSDHEPSPAPTPSSAEKRLFYSDRRGDEFNIKYGSLHKGDIPRYWRLGAGRVIGLNSGMRITRESAYTGKDLQVGANTTYRTPRYVDSRAARHTTDRYIKRVKLIAPKKQPQILGVSNELSAVATTDASEDPFLPSMDDGDRFVSFDVERSFAEKLSTTEFEQGQEYRSISGQLKTSDLELGRFANDVEEDEDFAQLGIEGGESQDDYIKRRNIEIDRQLRQEPENVNLWIEFVDFQDEVILSSSINDGGSNNRKMNKEERASTSEIKLSILNRALGAAPSNSSSEKLLLLFLRTAGQLWDSPTLLAKWRETLAEHPHLTGLWVEYVGWRQTTWAGFGVREVLEVYVECLGVLGNKAENAERGSADRENLEGNSIYLFLRCCLMLRQAGFAERALAAFQTIVELNFFRPSDFIKPLPREEEEDWVERVFASFESFWDSGAPRIGEGGAKGWCNTSEDSPPPPTSEPTPSSVISTSNPFERWLLAEQHATATKSRPARADDPGIDDDVDPFRAILFDDVRDFVFLVHSHDSLIQLAYAFLTFLGLPFIPPDYPTSTPFSTDTFIHTELAERPSLRDRYWPLLEICRTPFDIVQGEAMEREKKSDLTVPWDAPFNTAPATVDSLFKARPGWFETMGKQSLTHLDVGLCRNVFDLLHPHVKDGFFTVNYFAFESAQSPKSAVKLAKTILRTSRQNLALWDAYARIERSRNKIEDARSVYVTALSMSRTFEERDQIDAPLLWKSWAEMEWEEGRPILALRVLSAAATLDSDLSAVGKSGNDERPAAGQILKARQYYNSQLEAAFQPSVTQAILRNRNHLAYSFAIFEYVSQGLNAAVQVLEQHLFRLDCAGTRGSAEFEEAYMLYARLLYRHAGAGGAFRPGQLRDTLERAIKEFPNNSNFLNLFYFNELRMKIQNRVRKTLEESVIQEKIVTSQGWLFAIFAELHLDARSQNPWGVRNLFDRAIEHPNTKCSASIWSLYIDFEIRNGDLNRAKALTFRGIRECPWCKELYLKAFSPHLRPSFRSKELRQVHSLLLEKGLRVRLELDGFLRGWSSSDVEDEGDEEPAPLLLKETEELYSERRRLMPY
ncbi:DUF1740-domain-containing protein [Meredithblackwellia eburnea MCA 4105]